MTKAADLRDIVLFLVGHAPAPLGITQLMKLVYLADTEHVRLYGEPLTNVTWTWHHHGPFTPAVYDAVETLGEEGVVDDEVVVSGTERRRSVAPGAATQAVDAALDRLSPRACRVLRHVLARYGHLSLPRLKQVAYETAPMRAAQPGDRLDLSLEPRRNLAASYSPLADFLRRAPGPDRRHWGDPAVAAAEDTAIMRDLQRWRSEANQEIK